MSFTFTLYEVVLIFLSYCNKSAFSKHKEHKKNVI